MHFRQRIAWLLVLGYLAATCAIVYYIFEISDHYNVYALEHVERFHNNDADADEGSESQTHWHLADVPLVIWLVISLLPYLQVFCMLMACTKPEPRLSLAFLWPIYVALRCKRLYQVASGQTVSSSGNDSKHRNGHYCVIDT